MIIEGGGDPGNILQEMLDDRKKYYQRANVRVATDNLTPEVTAKEILKVLKSL